MSTLFLVATPIGNLEDMTPRGLRVLREAALVAAEDTRTARRLLQHFGVDARLTSYNEHNMRVKTPVLLDALAADDVALVSDAGMPGISDPGHELVVAALAAGHGVVAVPGATALVAAVAVSGLPARRFHYLGFLPRQSGPRRRALRDAAASGDTLIIFESPHRLRSTLEDVAAVLGAGRRMAVCRELTKLFEETWRGAAEGALAHFTEPRGEFTLVIEGGPPASATDGSDGAAGIAEAVARMRADGWTARDAVAELRRRFGMARRRAYDVWNKA